MGFKTKPTHMRWIAIFWFAPLYACILLFFMAFPIALSIGDGNMSKELGYKILGIEACVAYFICLFALIHTNILNKGRENGFINFILLEWTKFPTLHGKGEVLLTLVSFFPILGYYIALFKLSKHSSWLNLPPPSEIEPVLFIGAMTLGFSLNPFLGKYIWPYNSDRVFSDEF